MRHRKKLVLALGLVLLAVSSVWASWLFGFWQSPSSFVQNFDHVIEKVPPLVAGPWENRFSGDIPILHGKTMQHVKSEMGTPNSIYEFSMGGRLDEFRCELMNVYPPGNPRSAGVRIQEWQWQYPGFRVAIWFHKIDGRWIVLDSCRWKDGVTF